MTYVSSVRIHDIEPTTSQIFAYVDVSMLFRPVTQIATDMNESRKTLLVYISATSYYCPSFSGYGNHLGMRAAQRSLTRTSGGQEYYHLV